MGAGARLHRWALAGMVSYSVPEESGSGIQVGLVGNAHHGDEAPSADCLNHHVSHHLLLPHPSEDYYCQPVVGQAPRNTCKIVCEERRHRLARSVAASFTANIKIFVGGPSPRVFAKAGTKKIEQKVLVVFSMPTSF